MKKPKHIILVRDRDTDDVTISSSGDILSFSQAYQTLYEQWVNGIHTVGYYLRSDGNTYTQMLKIGAKYLPNEFDFAGQVKLEGN